MKQTHVKSVIFWTALVAFVLFAVPWLFQDTGRLSEPLRPRTRAIHEIKQTLIASVAYAADHEGKYPPSLGSLYPDYIDDLDFLFVKDEAGRPRILIYFPGRTNTDDPRAVLLEHPVRFGSMRIVGYAGGHVVAVEDP